MSLIGVLAIACDEPEPKAEPTPASKSERPKAATEPATEPEPASEPEPKPASVPEARETSGRSRRRRSRLVSTETTCSRLTN